MSVYHYSQWVSVYPHLLLFSFFLLFSHPRCWGKEPSLIGMIGWRKGGLFCRFEFVQSIDHSYIYIHESASNSIPFPFRRSLTYPTKSSNTLGHAPSSDHHPIDSSSKHFCTKTPVWSHMSLLTLFRHRSSRYAIHHSSHGVVGVAQCVEGACSRRRQYSIAVSSGRDFWPPVRASIKVLL